MTAPDLQDGPVVWDGPVTLRELLVPIVSLSPFPGNPRRGNVALIADSLRQHGQYRPVVANLRTMEVLAGNHTLLGAVECGWSHLAVTWVDVDPEQAARIVLIDNRASDLAGYDDVALSALLESLPDTVGTGFSDQDLAELLASIGDPDSNGDPDDVPDLPEVAPLCQVGDVWLLGPHRLVVGDSTSQTTVDALLAGDAARVDLLLTDPPYGVSYVGGPRMKAPRRRIENDELRDDQLQALLLGAFQQAAKRLKPGAPWYVFSTSGAQQTAFRLALDVAGLRLRSEIVWVKNALVLGGADYHPRHESVLHGDLPLEPPDPDSPDDADHEVLLYGWADGARHTWRGGRKQSTVWEFPRPSVSKDHPTMKPVAMLEHAIRNSTPAGGVVLDLFAGSGSTVIACHGTSRIARVVELDRRYADVICRRYQAHTGVVPVLLGGGPRSFLEQTPPAAPAAPRKATKAPAKKASATTPRKRTQK